MSQYLPTCEFQRSSVNCNLVVNKLVQIPGKNEYGFFTECELEHPGSIKERTRDIPLFPHQTAASCQLFSDYMNSVKQQKYKPTTKLCFYTVFFTEVCDLTSIYN